MTKRVAAKHAAPSASKRTKTKRNSASKKTAVQSNAARKKPATKKPARRQATNKQAIHQASSNELVKADLPTRKATVSEQAQLAILSPYRYPIQLDAIAIQTARLSGALFVVLGAVFAFLHTHYLTAESPLATLSESVKQVAQVCETTIDGECIDETTSTTDTSPAATITVDSPEPLAGIVPIRVYVPDADAVAVSVVETVSRDEIQLGAARQVDVDVWEMPWDTTLMVTGEYQVRANIQNQFGTYQEDSAHYQVTNQTAAEIDSTVTEDTTLDTSDSSNSIDDTEETDTVDTDTDVTASEPNDSEMDDAVLDVSTTAPQRSTAEAEIDPISGCYDDDIPCLEAYYSDTELVNDIPIVLFSVGERNTGVVSGIADLTLIAYRVQTAVLNAQNLATQNIYPIGTYDFSETDTIVTRLDSALLPNGQYRFLVDITSSYGPMQIPSKSFMVENEVTQTQVGNPAANEDQAPNSVSTDDQSEPLNVEPENAVSEPIAATSTSPPTISVEAGVALRSAFYAEVEVLRDQLATAVRTGDSVAERNARAAINDLIDELIPSDGDTETNALLRNELEATAAEVIARTGEMVTLTNQIKAERTVAVSRIDTDADGISDYDEVMIYNTDATTNDTDGDGLYDAAELLSGYDPLDSNTSTRINYESPQRFGIVRADMLSVDSIATVSGTSEESAKPRALFSGRALPNSFVTLYIFSTPIVVTVKTNPDGGWQYHFDKELADGEHEVYVGVTDNAGRVIAKSEPLRFIKEAQAFAPIDASGAVITTDTDESSLIADNLILLVLSFSVITIGLTLILLGLHLDGRPREKTQITQPASKEPAI